MTPVSLFASTTLMTRTMPIEELRNRAPRSQRNGEFSPHLPKAPVPLGGTVTYSLGPEWIEFGPSQIATPTTFVEVEGRTAYGEQSRLTFHVTSSDWQDSDRIFAGMLTALGNRTRAIPVDGFERHVGPLEPRQLDALEQRGLDLKLAVESPGGALWMRDDSGTFVQVARWNFPAIQASEPEAGSLLRFFETRQWVIDLDECRRNAELYEGRNRVERLVGKAKQFRGIATRYDKLDITYLAQFHLVAAFIKFR